MPMTEPELAALNTWLAGTDEGCRFDLLTITTRTGLVLRWTNADVPLTTPDNRTFVPAAYERDRLKVNANLQIDDVQLTVFVDSVDAIAGQPMLHFAARGGLDGARVMLEWLFLDVDGAQKGYVTRFEGRTGPAETGLGTVEVSMRSLIAQLERMVPAEIYQPGCRNTIYDAFCGLSVAAAEIPGTVTGLSGVRLDFFSSGLGQAAGFFDLGAVRFTSGLLEGEQRTVRAYAAGGVQTVLPWPSQPAIGDTFVIRPGCDRTKARCSALGNVIRFRGEPHIPAPETAS
ncbi:DUF2163 domain-containing protein [Roseateles sp. DC23W]|uniref:DUF2163 domain-containing protein n=1 Tax=Pelomonas dachongensis TaxID=3299029 RepID=A0ABW7EK08_9BURK